MHHTDYNNNLRKAQHKNTKNRILGAISFDSVDDRSKELVRAAIAAVLVLVALLQMDPANAQPTLDAGGYGTLQLGGEKQAIRAPVLGSELKMTIHDDQLNMVIDQTFSNPTQTSHTGEYKFALPANAHVKSWRLQLEDCPLRQHTQQHKCLPAKKLAAIEPVIHASRLSDRLLLTIPTVGPNQRVSIHLDIAFLNSETDLPATTQLALQQSFMTNPVKKPLVKLESTDSVVFNQDSGVLQPL